ncbi:PEPxxWA-CTERM sorting domain-containing protein [Parasphingorhabdus sp.]|uniref:PEPxxWA-CTERM sorting domain-containing protein n=1 Tax=Parasphingorhabdus sp. TaxID=2709688 RepID=UPI003BAF12F2
MRKLLVALALSAATIAPAHAGVVFSDNFDGENGGNSALNYTGYANFASTGAGTTDVVKNGDFGIACSGSCVDLDGSPGPGELTSLNSFAFNAGDFVRLSFDLGGNQRRSGNDGYFVGFDFGSSIMVDDYGINFGGTDQIVIPSTNTSNITTSSGIAFDAPFFTRSIFFTAGEAGSLNFKFGSSSADNVGPLLDNVVLEIGAPVPEPATWAMMIFGFGLVGGAMRRNRKSLTAKPALA